MARWMRRGERIPESDCPMLPTAGEQRSPDMPKGFPAMARPVVQWLVFFLICLGLGYAGLNRYDPAKIGGTSDAAVYRDMVVRGAPPEVASISDPLMRLGRAENYYRILVPRVARPFYLLMNGRSGSWDAALFGLLIANSLFTSATGSLLVAVGRRLGVSLPTALLAATLYLLNFAVANLNLAGLIDSGEACFLMAVVWSLLAGRWYLLPLWGILGALAKETFAPLSIVFVLGWWFAAEPGSRLRLSRIPWICALAISSVLTVAIAMSSVAGGWMWPWGFAASMHAGVGFVAGLRGCIFNHTFWYVFAWLLPLGILRLRRLPLPWVVASGAAFCAALALGAYNDAGGNATRALFSVAGPILSLSAAMFMTGPGLTLESSAKAAADNAPPS